MINILIYFHNSKQFDLFVIGNFLSHFKCAAEEHKSSLLLDFDSVLPLVRPTIFLGILARTIIGVSLVLSLLIFKKDYSPFIVEINVMVNSSIKLVIPL